MPERHAQFPDRADLDRLAALALPRQVAADLKALAAALSPRADAVARRPASLAAQDAGMA
jgi:hypothetical protein